MPSQDEIDQMDTQITDLKAELEALQSQGKEMNSGSRQPPRASSPRFDH